MTKPLLVTMGLSLCLMGTLAVLFDRAPVRRVPDAPESTATAPTPSVAEVVEPPAPPDPLPDDSETDSWQREKAVKEGIVTARNVVVVERLARRDQWFDSLPKDDLTDGHEVRLARMKYWAGRLGLTVAGMECRGGGMCRARLVGDPEAPYHVKMRPLPHDEVVKDRGHLFRYQSERGELETVVFASTRADHLPTMDGLAGPKPLHTRDGFGEVEPLVSDMELVAGGT